MALTSDWLKEELLKVTEWDESLLQEVVGAISNANNSDEIEDIVRVSHIGASSVQVPCCRISCPVPRKLEV